MAARVAIGRFVLATHAQLGPKVEDVVSAPSRVAI